MGSSEYPAEDLFNILIATDIHLGYMEKDPIRGDDSFIAFEEILKVGVENDVDFILLGGDLFHDNKPSLPCLHRCIDLLRRHCMGEKSISVEFLSDQSENFQHCSNPVVNYEDPNLNVSFPVYSIHGNHDDHCGFGGACALDVLSSSGLVNFFGKWTDYTKVNISPLLLRKGVSRLALYGLGHIKDERLARLYKNKMVHLHQPKEFRDDWFNLLVLHQNRADRGPNKYLSEDSLPSFLDLVFWGHEHECRIVPEWNACREFYVTQPGSPVATSLCHGEAAEKHVALLKVYKKTFKVDPVKLLTVRPFVFDTVKLSTFNFDVHSGNYNEQVICVVDETIEAMLRRTRKFLTGHPKQPILPLLRLRVEYQDERQMFNVVRFSQKLLGKVANPMDTILLRKEKQCKAEGSGADIDKEALGSLLQGQQLRHEYLDSIERVVEKYFMTVETERKLKLLSTKGMAEAVSRFLDKEDNESIDVLISHQSKLAVKHMEDSNIAEENLEKEFEKFRDDRSCLIDDDLLDAWKSQEAKAKPISREESRMDPVELSSGDDSDSDASFISGRGGRGAKGTRARGSRAQPRARARARGRAARGAAQQSIEESFQARSSSRPRSGRPNFSFL